MQPIMRINLSTNEIDDYIIPHQWEIDYLGGASLGARLLYEELLPDLDPLSERASLLFLNGPLSGTSGPAVGRFVVCAKSPATGLWGESNCGGFWGPELRMAGYYGLWITGKAETPVYISIIDGKVEILPAGHIWGFDTYSTQATIKADLEVKNPRLAVIGPAGEASIPFASILTDHGRMAGRTGMGAVMGKCQ
jgi:aldehyde:ferredoxin oxidoreductase